MEENNEEIRHIENGASGIINLFKVILKIIFTVWAEMIIFAEILITFAIRWILDIFGVKSIIELINQILDPLNLVANNLDSINNTIDIESILEGGVDVISNTVILWLILNIVYYMVCRFLKAKTALKIELVLSVIVGFAIFAILNFDLINVFKSLDQINTDKIEKYKNLMETFEEKQDILNDINTENIISENGEVNMDVVQEILQDEEIKQEVMNVLQDEQIKSDVATILESEGIDSSVLNTIVEEGFDTSVLNEVNFNTIDLNSYDMNKVNNMLDEYNLTTDPNMNLNNVDLSSFDFNMINNY